MAFEWASPLAHASGDGLVDRPVDVVEEVSDHRSAGAEVLADVELLGDRYVRQIIGGHVGPSEERCVQEVLAPARFGSEMASCVRVAWREEGCLGSPVFGGAGIPVMWRRHVWMSPLPSAAAVAVVADGANQLVRTVVWGWDPTAGQAEKEALTG